MGLARWLSGRLLARSSLRAKINRARPPLYTVAPLSFAILWGYAVINIAIGTFMIILYPSGDPIEIANVLPYLAWGIIFLLLGILTAYGLLRNLWDLTRNTQLAGVTVKTIWLIALVVATIHSPKTILITIIWLFFAYIQVVTYIYFVPGSTYSADLGGEDV
jgi:hypothetical protein